MADLIVKEGNLAQYTHGMIRYAVYNHPEEVVHLLQINGVQVPENADYKMLHAMTLKALITSQSFSNDLQKLLHAIAMDAQYAKYKTQPKSGGYSNQTGDAGNDTDSTTNTNIGNKGLLNPKTVDSILAGGLDLISKLLGKSGDSGIQDKVNESPTPPQVTPPKSNTATILAITALAVAVGGILYYRSKNK